MQWPVSFLPFLPSWTRWWCAFSMSCRSLWFECVWLHSLVVTYLSCALVREGSTWPIWTAWLSGVQCWCSVTDEAHFCCSSCVAGWGNCFPACQQIWNSATWVDATLRNPLAGYQAARETKDEEIRKALMNIKGNSDACWHPGHTDFPFLKLIWGKKCGISASLQIVSDSGVFSILHCAVSLFGSSTALSVQASPRQSSWNEKLISV